MLLNKKSQKWFNFHNCLFGGLLFTVLIVLMQTLQSSFSGFIQLVYEKNVSNFVFDLTTCDYKIPVAPWLSLFYLSTIPTWSVFPVFIYVIYGRKRFSKLLTIALFCYLTTFLIDIVFPANCVEIHNYGKLILENKTGFFNELSYKIVSDSFPWTSFPSNHCTNQLILMFAIIDFNFVSKTFEKDTKLKLTIKIFFALLISFYSVSVCASTFVLKTHYFVDWIPSLFIVLLFFVIFTIFENNHITKWTYKQILNFNYAFWYIPKLPNNKYLSWGGIHHPRNFNKLPTRKLIKHFVLWDILISIFYGLILFIIWNSILVISWFSIPNFYAKLTAFCSVTIISLITFLFFLIYHQIFKKIYFKNV